MKYRIIEPYIDKELFECACKLNDARIISIEEVEVFIDNKRKNRFLSVVVNAKYPEDLYYIGRYIGQMSEGE